VVYSNSCVSVPCTRAADSTGGWPRKARECRARNSFRGIPSELVKQKAVVTPQGDVLEYKSVRVMHPESLRVRRRGIEESGCPAGGYSSTRVRGGRKSPRG
jgi:hypothetical protein